MSSRIRGRNAAINFLDAQKTRLVARRDAAILARKTRTDCCGTFPSFGSPSLCASAHHRRWPQSTNGSTRRYGGTLRRSCRSLVGVQRRHVCGNTFRGRTQCRSDSPRRRRAFFRSKEFRGLVQLRIPAGEPNTGERCRHRAFQPGQVVLPAAARWLSFHGRCSVVLAYPSWAGNPSPGSRIWHHPISTSSSWWAGTYDCPKQFSGIRNWPVSRSRRSMDGSKFHGQPNPRK